MKKNSLVSLAVLTVMLLLGPSVFAAGTYSGGDGLSAATAYQIATPADMQQIGANLDDWDKHFILIADPNLSAYTGTSFNIIGNETTNFTGKFDGNSHTIDNFTYTSTATDHIGLFGWVGTGGEIKDLGVINVSIDAGTGSSVASLVGFNTGQVTNSYSTGSVSGTGSRVGGLVGRNDGTVTNSYSTGSVSGTRYVGGLVGENWDGTVTTCYSTGSVSGTGWYVGGLVGRSFEGTVTNSYSTGFVNGDYYVGGLMGRSSYGTVTYSYSTGSVSGTGFYVGGLVGLNSYGTVTTSYSTGSVSGTRYVGGLVGESWDGAVTTCYSTGSVSGSEVIGGLVGLNYSGTVTNSYSTGSVSGTGSLVGGLVGEDWDGTVTNSYSTGSVSGDGIVGGLMGLNVGTNATVTNCYSTGSVSGVVDVGGLVGLNDSGTVTNSFWDTVTSGMTVGVGSGSSAGVTGKTTAEMQTQSTFADPPANWDFTTDWKMSEINSEFGGYPVAIWQTDVPSPGDMGGGSGTAGDPYLIEDMNDFDVFCDPANSATYWSAGVHTKLVADLDLSAYTGTAFNIIGNDTTNFTGTFDGNGHTIDNFTYTSTATDFIALFGCVGTGGEIKDLGVINVSIDAGTGYYVASLVGLNFEGTVTNSYSTGSVSGAGYWVGGLVGWNYGNSSTVTNSYSTGSVSGGSDVGGLVGYNDYGTVTNSYSTGSVSGGSNVGGLVGRNYGTVTSSYSTGSVSGSYNVGGLVGRNNAGTVTNSYSTGSVSGGSNVGGLVGYNSDTVTNSYSTGSVSGVSDVGGLVGRNYDTVTNSFWDAVTSGMATSDGGTGKTTSEMQMEITFSAAPANWDFVTVWKMSKSVSEFGGCPVLLWQTDVAAPGDMGSGSGTAGDPYLIEDMSDFDVFCDPANSATYWAAGVHTKLVTDLDLSAYTGTSFNIIGNDTTKFTGTFDGNGHTIDNFTYTSTDINFIGLFGSVGTGGEIKDLGVINVSIDAGTGTLVGGLVGKNYGTVTNSYSTGSVSGGGLVGGLVGYNYDGTVMNSYSTGSVSGNYRVGGVVGSNNRGAVTNSYSTGSVSGTGSVVGGLVGENYSGQVTSSYSTGSVSGTGDDVGGLVGYNYDGTVTNNFWDTVTSGMTVGVGTGSSAGVTGKTTGEMQSESTYTDWDFTTVWKMSEISSPFGGYPVAVWQTNVPSPGDMGNGSGTAGDPYLIQDMSDFDVFCDPVNSATYWISGVHTKLTTDLDLAAYTGTSFNIIGTTVNSKFTGTFDGNGHTIDNFTYTSTGTDFFGLFGYVGTGGEIKDLGLTNVSIDVGTGGVVGGLVGWNFGTVTNSYSTGSVSGSNDVGGLVGLNYGTVTNSYSTGSVNGDRSVGGLVGENGDTVTNSYSTGSVNGDRSVGGLVGYNADIVTNSYSTGPVSGAGYVGGLVGLNEFSTVTNSYSTGSVSGSYDVGGLVGWNDIGTVTNSYSTGSVSGTSDVGGLMGRSYSGTVTNSFWDTVTSGMTVGVGNNAGIITNVTGKTTADMQMELTFSGTPANWDFVTPVWKMIRENEDYPRLDWQPEYAGDFAGLYGVDTVDFAAVSEQWLETGCAAKDDCNGADVDQSGTVNIDDLLYLIDDWLEGK